MREVIRRTSAGLAGVEVRVMLERIGEYTFLVGGLAPVGSAVDHALALEVRRALDDRTTGALIRASAALTIHLDKEIAKYVRATS